MKRYIYLIISALLISMSFHSCKEPDLTPVYLHITLQDLENCIDVSDFNATHDQNFDQEQLEALKRHRFTHVNVYVDNKNLGCWELPCKVPVLDVNSNDTSTLILIPAIPISGMSNTIWGYPFLNICRQKVILQKGTTYEVGQTPPTYVYSEYARFPFFETFSNSSSFTSTDTAHDALTFVPVSYEGRNVGEIVLSDSTYQSFDVSSSKFVAPVGSYRVMLEITYKTDVNVDISMKMSSAYNPHMAYSIGGFKASPNVWKTIHFDLANTINTYHSGSGSATEVNLILSAAGEKGKVSRVEIDDIKVIYIRTA
ncbi:MAG: hypothetical protein J6X98_03665 [Bacteroidales bacterium]|nr:hypothetical protein [Bacteroidales bacterium]